MEKPAEIIEEKYEQIYEEVWENSVKFNFAKNQFGQKFVKNIYSTFQELQQSLENTSKIVEGKGRPFDIL